MDFLVAQARLEHQFPAHHKTNPVVAAALTEVARQKDCYYLFATAVNELAHQMFTAAVTELAHQNNDSD